MSQYQELDQRITDAIRAGKNPLYAQHVSEEAKRLAEATGRESFRVIDGRLQQLRKSGKIQHVSKVRGSDTGGWSVVGKEAG